MSVMIIIRILLDLAPFESPYLIEVVLEYCHQSLVIAFELSGIEIITFGYYCKRILKRIPEYDIDFLAFCFLIINTILSIYLGSLHTFGKLNKNPCQRRPLK